MSKELEALEGLKTSCFYDNERNEYVEDTDEFKIIKQALQRLEVIDNAKPSKALECLERIDKEYTTIECEDFDTCFNTIKQALLKAQEQEKVLKIISKKRVDLSYLRCCFEDNQSVYRYNEYIANKTIDYDHEEELIEEEFASLKEWMK